MRVVLATAVAALAVAAPAGAVSIPESTAFAISAHVQTKQKEKGTCQAGSKKKLVFRSGHPPVVACEQPPRSNLMSPDSAAKATAAALSVLG
jgi:hypothetical protein